MTTSEAETGAVERDAGDEPDGADRTEPVETGDDETAGSRAPEEEPSPAPAPDTEHGSSWWSRLTGAVPRRFLPRPGSRLPTLLVVLAGVLAGTGGWFLTEGMDLRASDSVANRALVDVEGTNEVSAAMTSALNRVFSYSHDDVDRSEEAAAEVLRDEAREEYEALFPQVRARAPEQELTLTANVSAAAVQHLDDERAELLVFLDQHAVREADEEPATAGAQLAVTAERADGDWVITEIEPH